MGLSDSQSKEFVRLVTEHQPELFYYVLSLVPHRADAEEILQDTHLYLWEHFAEFELGSNFRAWSFQVAYHRVQKFFGSQQRRKQVFSDQFLSYLATSAAESRQEAGSQQALLDTCLDQLNNRDRKLLESRYQPGATVASIATELKRNVDAVYRALRRVHQVLFECLQRKLALEDAHE